MKAVGFQWPSPYLIHLNPFENPTINYWILLMNNFWKYPCTSQIIYKVALWNKLVWGGEQQVVFKWYFLTIQIN